jgi:hypothetical protein
LPNQKGGLLLSDLLPGWFAVLPWDCQTKSRRLSKGKLFHFNCNFLIDNRRRDTYPSPVRGLSSHRHTLRVYLQNQQSNGSVGSAVPGTFPAEYLRKRQEYFLTHWTAFFHQ